MRELTAQARELRRLLGNVAGNLNDAARHANSGSEPRADTDAVLAHTRAMNARIDDWLMQTLRTLRWRRPDPAGEARQPTVAPPSRPRRSQRVPPPGSAARTRSSGRPPVLPENVPPKNGRIPTHLLH
ncbi:hypothetical protein [Prescottella subtropica]|uniref:hypothetical protein n=1 Tax=Prescottella subtropica TaxID=2545757 RepID=UPI0010F9F6A8|nr:hypothetical protein [Prescottella subtropica]